MKHHDAVICQIIAMHHSGKDIESIARILRLNDTKEKWDIHYIGIIVMSYVNEEERYRGSEHIAPDTVCKADGVFRVGDNAIMCPLYRKPTDKS
jgi:hypothetical protein